MMSEPSAPPVTAGVGYDEDLIDYSDHEEDYPTPNTPRPLSTGVIQTEPAVIPVVDTRVNERAEVFGLGTVGSEHRAITAPQPYVTEYQQFASANENPAGNGQGTEDQHGDVDVVYKIDYEDGDQAGAGDGASSIQDDTFDMSHTARDVGDARHQLTAPNDGLESGLEPDFDGGGVTELDGHDDFVFAKEDEGLGSVPDDEITYDEYPQAGLLGYEKETLQEAPEEAPQEEHGLGSLPEDGSIPLLADPSDDTQNTLETDADNTAGAINRPDLEPSDAALSAEAQPQISNPNFSGHHRLGPDTPGASHASHSGDDTSVQGGVIAEWSAKGQDQYPDQDPDQGQHDEQDVRHSTRVQHGFNQVDDEVETSRSKHSRDMDEALDSIMQGSRESQDNTGRGFDGMDDEITDLPSIIISWQAEEYPLFATDNQMGFFTDESVLDLSMDALLAAFRAVLKDEVRDDETMVIQVDELGLEYAQNTRPDYLQQISLRKIIELQIRLIGNEAERNPRGLYAFLSARSDPVARIAMIIDAIRTGKGLDKIARFFQPPPEELVRADVLESDADSETREDEGGKDDADDGTIPEGDDGAVNELEQPSHASSPSARDGGDAKQNDDEAGAEDKGAELVDVDVGVENVAAFDADDADLPYDGQDRDSSSHERFQEQDDHGDQEHGHEQEEETGPDVDQYDEREDDQESYPTQAHASTYLGAAHTASYAEFGDEADGSGTWGPSNDHAANGKHGPTSLCSEFSSELDYGNFDVNWVWLPFVLSGTSDLEQTPTTGIYAVQTDSSSTAGNDEQKSDTVHDDYEWSATAEVTADYNDDDEKDDEERHSHHQQEQERQSTDESQIPHLEASQDSSRYTAGSVDEENVKANNQETASSFVYDDNEIDYEDDHEDAAEVASPEGGSETPGNLKSHSPSGATKRLRSEYDQLDQDYGQDAKRHRYADD